MADRYEPVQFEARWRKRWAEADLFRTREEPGRPKFYGLDFFPYPSGAGLSVGHCRNYIPTDVLCRMKTMQGFNVLHPMGFDAFGLPAENEAIAKKTTPAPMIDRYAETYRRQMDLVGISYDWSRSFKSSDPSYYKWTQWIFKVLYQRGLAYRKPASVNWCPVDNTVLADEEVQGGLCWRCGTPVEKKWIPQWFFKITAYAQRLLDDLDKIDWPEGIKQMQRNWIGRSEGVEFSMRVVFGGPAASRADSGPLPMPGDPDLEALRTEVAIEVQPSPEVEQARRLAASIEDAARSIEGPTAFEKAMDDFERHAEKIQVKVQDKVPYLRVFTTRIDTIFGVTFCVIAPEHPLVETLIAQADSETAEAIRNYRTEAASMGEQDRLPAAREKTGVFSGAYAINPANGARVPIWIADYVLMNYGTGAIMGVPGHDERDFEFAGKFGLEVVRVIDSAVGANEPLPFPAKDGVMVNSGEYEGLTVAEGQRRLGEWIEGLGIGERKVNFKLRDWLISRQRYWGCPIPVIHTKDGEEQLVPDDQLPVYLPEVENYEPSGDGSSPLTRIPEFVNVTDLDGRLGRRETDTMGGFACSSWYFLRFCDPHNEDRAWDKDKVDYWMPVDAYVGGAEHAVMHLLYARFWTKVLFDAGYVPVDEPFQRLQNQGMLLAPTPFRKPRPGEKLSVGQEGIQITFDEARALPPEEVFFRMEKMSKSKGNVVTPEEAVEKYGADGVRIFELFVAPFEQSVPWSEEGATGAVRFLSRVFKLVAELAPHYDRQWKTSIDAIDMEGVARDVRRATHKAILKSTHDIERFAFNTYISCLMTFVNEVNEAIRKSPDPDPALRLALSEALESLILILSPAAPHSADELWESIGNAGFTFLHDWPTGDPALAADDEVQIAIQVNGKLRDTLTMPAGASQIEMESAARASAKVQTHLEGKTVRKVVVVPGRLVNIVAN